MQRRVSHLHEKPLYGRQHFRLRHVLGQALVLAPCWAPIQTL